MDYGRPDRCERLAAEYVLGTLRGPARRRLEALLPAHPALRRAVAGWQARLDVLAGSVPAVEPPPTVWRGIERRLFGATATPAAPAAVPPWWQRLGVWRGGAAFAATAALVFGLLLLQPVPVQPPIVVVMTASGAAPTQGVPVTFVASLNADGRSLVLKPLAGVELEAQRTLELWAVPAQGAPRSLGLVSSQLATTVRHVGMLRGTAALAVSVEPAGGSPTGAPTGPIVSVGKLEI